MASILKVDTITGVATAGSIAITGEGNSTTTNLQQGLAKSWVNFDGTGTIAARDSFNHSSLTDRGTGFYAVTITSAMSSNDFYGGAQQRANGYAAGPNGSEEFTTTGITTLEYYSGTSLGDRQICGFMILGDLA